ncbi:lysozyme inhibitor LprI family protein [Antarcticirhabdus aurantiaca]|uniref:DUF1311 domain-containing protein n=1 Tax=Antarcticirhabdus aurantiaca TaxID=2606717 RepID=A0ACD4NHB3_9HYPH|nr:lysozyme inhibitor LprI family protein [Antarcticirhabdus aurantiaca]WAJ26176.1 DUF1311 domain-containing protein [Jeongeuplla avenae]
MNARLCRLAAALALATVAFAPLAQADEKQDLKTLRACLGEKSEDENACIDVVANPCVEEPDGSTTVGITECLSREEAAWDVLLNERYEAQVKSAKAMDAELKGNAATENATSVLKSLKTAQRAWIAYRDAECERRWANYQGGTIASNIAAACTRDMTANRAIDFAPDAG